MNFEHDLEQLKNELGIIADLQAAAALLDWDMRTYMTPGAIESRAFQLASLEEVAHARAVSAELGHRIDRLAARCPSLDPDSDERRLIEKVRRNFERERRTPASWVRRNAEACSRANTAWERAREEKSFRIFAPHLQELLELKQEYLGFFEPYVHPCDPLLDRFDEGMTCADLDPIFAHLKKEQSVILRKALERPVPDLSFLKGRFPASKQIALTEQVLSWMGYDWNCGRQDRSVHPFTTTIGLYDVRVTTKIYPGKPFSALFSSVHEGGHALYEQGIEKKYARTPLGDGASFSVHESQSRLWENLVARSSEFWTFWYPQVQKLYPSALKGVSFERFLAAIRLVEPSPVRVEADELTYNMHIILRYELEKAMLEGRLKVADLADAWNAGMKELLGIEIRNDTEGVLQDVHWAMGEFGYFPSYALGNVISAQLWEAALRDKPEIPREIAAGNCAPLREWLRSHVHRYGAKYDTKEILKIAAGKAAVDPEPYLRMLKEKYL